MRALDFVLTPVEARVLACLVEKEITTPEYYPLTPNALKAACNQKSNRDPVMELDTPTILEALDRLRYEYHVVWETRVAGSRTLKYRHSIRDVYDFTPRELAIMTELMLRGPQTAGELRTHTRRLVEFDDLAQTEATVTGLMDWGGRRLVARLPPGPGRREPRFAHLLCGEDSLPEPDVRAEPPPSPAPRPDRLADLEQEVASLRESLTALRNEFDQFRTQFG